MQKPTESTINIFIDKLDKSGLGTSSMQNKDVYLVPYALPGETIKAKTINKTDVSGVFQRGMVLSCA